MTQEYDISFVQGDTFSEVWSTSFSLSGYTARMKIKKTPSETEVLSLTDTSGITLSGTSITITITPALSALIDGGRYLYDLRLIDSGGAVSTFRKGYVDVVSEISSED